VPKSRMRRKKDAGYTTPSERKTSAAAVPSRWTAPVMVALFVIGLAWIVLWYIAGTDVPGMRDWGVWNLVIGFGFIFGGLMVATRWR
jgi:hypothetical protein